MWVASKPGRSAGLKFPEKKDFLRIDVTSGSGNLLTFKAKKVPASQLSPLLLGPVIDCDGESAERVESLWQYRKVFPQLGHWDDESKRPTEAWFKWMRDGYAKLKGEKRAGRRAKGIRTPPEVAKLKKRWREHGEPWTPRCSWWKDRELSYVESRKEIYVPAYADAVQQTDAFRALETLVKDGKNVLIVDLDGPPLSDYPNGLPVTRENFLKSLLDTSHPFGHGFIVAALLAGVDVKELCQADNAPTMHKKRKTEL